MDESVKHRIIGGVVLAVMALSLAPVLLQLPAKPGARDDLNARIEPLTPENQLVDYEENWREPSRVASVNLDKDRENLAAEEVESQPILTQVKFDRAKPVAAAPVVAHATQASTTSSSHKQTAATTSTQPKTASTAHKPTTGTQPKTVSTAHKSINNTKVHSVTKSAVSKKVAQQHRKPAVTKKQPVRRSPALSKSAYTVQLASFSQLSNARVLRNKLRNKGYTAYIRSARGKHALHRVFVGPETNRQQSVQLAAKLKKEVKINGIVVHYHPSQG